MATRWRVPLLLTLVLAIFFAMALWMEAPEGMPASALDDWLQESPTAVGALLVLKYGSAAVGLLLLVLMWRRWDRIRTGQLPPPEPVAVTTPFPLGAALGIIGVTFVAVVFAGSLLAALKLDGAARMVAGMALLQTVLLGAAVVVFVRRRRLLADAPPAAGPGLVLGRATGAFCIASACVLPAVFFTFFALNRVGYEITLYGPIAEFITGGDTATPWLIALFSVVLAPIGEESLFRGMLYPALRSRLQGRDRAVVAAIVSSVLFALIHGHAPSFLPLFVLAMVLAWTFEKTNSLLVVILTHALWNASTLIPLLIRGTAG